MSFIDIRKFVAIMKVLGYSHTISMDSFRTPNFELVADCLHWLITRYEPTVDLDTDISVEARRVAFLKRATQVLIRLICQFLFKETFHGLLHKKLALCRTRQVGFITLRHCAEGLGTSVLLVGVKLHSNGPGLVVVGKEVSVNTSAQLSGARVKLNLRRLYSGDGYAVKELLKVAQLLQNATTAATMNEKEVADLGPFLKPFDVKATRLQVSEITKCGASLYDILETEPALQEARSRATIGNTDMDEIERSLREAITAMLESISVAEQEQINNEKDEKTMETKLEKRRLELERSEKRLSTLHNVRPAYMDKYEALQKDLHDLFVTYSEKHRNLQWLQSQMEGHRQEEQENLEEADRRMRRLQRRLHEEELCILRGQEVDGFLANAGSSEESDGEGATFWKWFDGSSFKSILEPRVKMELQRTNTADRKLAKGPSECMRQRTGMSEAVRKPTSNNKLRDGNPTTHVEDAKNMENAKPTTSDSHQISLNGSEMSGDSDEGDDELLDTDGLDPKDTGDGISTDDDF